MMENDQEIAAQWARSLLEREDWVILDTETTGLSQIDEIIQIAIIAYDGSLLLNTLVRPKQPISSAAIAIHGITNATLEEAPSFPKIYKKFKAVISEKTIVIYNAPFDLRLLNQTIKKYHLPQIEINPEQVECAMLKYSAWKGEIWSDGNYKWQKLPGGDHTALGDCNATLEIIKKMAG
jgi:DNA polymerase-3 subunit epsilon